MESLSYGIRDLVRRIAYRGCYQNCILENNDFIKKMDKIVDDLDIRQVLATVLLTTNGYNKDKALEILAKGKLLFDNTAGD